MTLLHEAVEAKKMDVRMVERNLSRGVIQMDDVEKSLKKLSDDSDNAATINVEALMGAEMSEDGESDSDTQS